MITRRFHTPTLAALTLTLACAVTPAPADNGLGLPPIDLSDPGADPVLDTAKPDPAGPATDGPTDTGDTATGWQKRFFDLNWRHVAAAYAEVDGRFVVVPNYDRRLPSSLGVSATDWVRDNTTAQRVNAGGIVRTERYEPAREEGIAAATRLPDLDPGSYGHIDSAEVVKVVSADEMIVTGVRLLDPELIDRQRAADRRTAARNVSRIVDQLVAAEADRLKETDRRDYRNSNSGNRRNTDRRDSDDTDRQLQRFRQKVESEQYGRIDEALEKRFAERDRLIQEQQTFASTKFRLIGFPTARLREGDRWTQAGAYGPQIAIVDLGDNATPDPRARSRSRNAAPTQLTAINGEMLRTGLGEDRFVELLKSRGHTPASFAELARPIMKDNPGYAVPQIVAALEQAPDATGAQPKPRPTPKRTPDQPVATPDAPGTPDKPADPPATADADPKPADADAAPGLVIPDDELFK